MDCDFERNLAFGIEFAGDDTVEEEAEEEESCVGNRREASSGNFVCRSRSIFWMDMKLGQPRKPSMAIAATTAMIAKVP
jgi:hypothetical protein